MNVGANAFTAIPAGPSRRRGRALAVLNSPDYVSSPITGSLLLALTIFWVPDISRSLEAVRRMDPRGADGT